MRSRVVETNPCTILDNNVPIDLARCIVIFEKRCKLLNVQVDRSAPSAISPPICNNSTRADLERPLQTSANVVAIFSERLKKRFCVIYDRQYTLDALRFALPRKRNVNFRKYVLLRNDAFREAGAVWSRSYAYTASSMTFGVRFYSALLRQISSRMRENYSICSTAP